MPHKIQVKQAEIGAAGAATPTSTDAVSAPGSESVKIRALRLLESKHAGFRTSELITILSSVALPLLDTSKDWSFTIWLGTSHGTLGCVRTAHPCMDCYKSPEDVCRFSGFGEDECLQQGTCCVWGRNDEDGGRMGCWENHNSDISCGDIRCDCPGWASGTAGCRAAVDADHPWLHTIANCQVTCFEHLPENQCAMGAAEPQQLPALCDHDEWFKTSLAIQLFAGFVCGVQLGVEQLHGSLGWPYWQAMPLALLVGLPGFSSAATAVICLHMRDPKQGLRSIKRMKMLELVVETLPQSAFQTFVALAQHQVRFALLGSIVAGLLSAGAAIFDAEKGHRDVKGMRLSTLSRYGVVRLFAVATQVATMIFIVSLIGNELPAGFAVTLLAMDVAYLVTITQASQSAKAMRCSFVFIIILQLGAVVGTFSILAAGIVNSKAEERMIGMAEREREAESEANERIFQPMLISLVATCILTPLSWALDPETGQPCLREKTWAERVKSDSERMSEQDVIQAKAEAVWRWMDIFKDGKLEVAEVDRLRDETQCSCISLYTALHNEQSGFLDQQRFIQVCDSDKQQLDAWFSVLKVELVVHKGFADKICECVGGTPDSEEVEARARILGAAAQSGTTHRHILAVVQSPKGDHKPNEAHEQIGTEQARWERLAA